MAYRDVPWLRNKFVAAGFWIQPFVIILRVMLPDLCLFQRLGTATMFFVSGAASMLRPFDVRRRVQRILMFAGIAATISVATWIAVPRMWIFFGVVHCFAAAEVVHMPFLLAPRWVTAIIGLLAGSTLFLQIDERDFIFGRRDTLDYIAFLPNFGWACLGIVAAEHLKGPSEYLHNTLVGLLSRNCLTTYVAHQLVLFPLTALLGQIQDRYMDLS